MEIGLHGEIGQHVVRLAQPYHTVSDKDIEIALTQHHYMEELIVIPRLWEIPRLKHAIRISIAQVSFQSIF